jgi:hypothetical protein
MNQHEQNKPAGEKGMTAKIRSFFQKGSAPRLGLALSALSMLDKLEKCLRFNQPLLAIKVPGKLVANSLNRLHRCNPDTELMVYPLSQADELCFRWTNCLGESLGDHFLPNLITERRYGEWESVWGSSKLVSDLTEMTMASPSVRGLRPETRMQVRHTIDQSLYHLLGFYFGSAAVGKSDMFNCLDTACRQLPDGVPLGLCDEYWKGWLIAGA